MKVSSSRCSSSWGQKDGIESTPDIYAMDDNIWSGKMSVKESKEAAANGSLVHSPANGKNNTADVANPNGAAANNSAEVAGLNLNVLDDKGSAEKSRSAVNSASKASTFSMSTPVKDKNHGANDDVDDILGLGVSDQKTGAASAGDVDLDDLLGAPSVGAVVVDEKPADSSNSTSTAAPSAAPAAYFCKIMFLWAFLGFLDVDWLKYRYPSRHMCLNPLSVQGAVL